MTEKTLEQAIEIKRVIDRLRNKNWKKQETYASGTQTRCETELFM